MSKEESMEKSVKNPKYVDLLDEDRPISGQNYVCLSFLSPDKILKKKEIFFFEQFLKYFDFTKSVRKFNQFLNFLSYKHNLDFDKVMNDFQDYLSTEQEKLSETSVSDEYKNFLDEKEDELTKEFDNLYHFQTNTRGIKVRGSFPTLEEAQLRSRMLREVDSNHDIYVGQVGMWMPWEPEAYKTGKVDYMEEELNQLMSEKKKNELNAKKAFDRRVRDAKKKAIEDNKEKAKKSGAKLTQDITKEGELIGVQNTSSTIERSLGMNEKITTSDIRKELFEGENIRTRSSADPQEQYKKNLKEIGKESAFTQNETVDEEKNLETIKEDDGENDTKN